MRTEDNRLKVKKLYLLGAGASYSLTKHGDSQIQKQAPLDYEFCKRITAIRDQCKWVKEAQDRIKKDWRDHHDFNELGLEEAIIKQIGHFDFLGGIHRRRSSSRKINDYIYDITHLIAVALNKVEQKNKNDVQAFIRNVFPYNQGEYKKQKNRIITFNYDTVIDKHLFNRFKLTEIYFDQIRTEANKISRQRSDGKKDHPLLIKLHGSINWRIDRQDLDNILDNNIPEKNKPNTQTYNTEGCYFIETITKIDNVPSTDDNNTPLIIPPLPQKPITSISLFRYLWTYAYEYLHECEELIICGYSLPEADTLAVSMFSNFSNKRIKKITIIDPNPMVIKKWKDLFFRKNINKHIIWEYYDDFTEYIKFKYQNKKKDKKL